MENQLTVQTASETPCCDPESTIPQWVNLLDLDRSQRYGYPENAIPRGSAPALRASASAYLRSLQPATIEERDRILRSLRLATIIRNESDQEARGSFALLRAHLDNVPLDILERACRAYVNAPGPRHYPRSAGELRAFTDPLMRERRWRSVLLQRLADQAALLDAERDRLEADPCTPEAIQQIKAEFGLRTDNPTAQRPEPAIEDYLRLGCSRAEAEEALAEGKAMREAGRPSGLRSPLARACATALARQGEGADSPDADAHAAAPGGEG